MKEIIVGTNEEGQRLDKLLLKVLNQANKSFIYKMLRKKNITLNNKKAAGNEMLTFNDSIKIFLSDETFDKFSKKVNVSNKMLENKNMVFELDVIYEDKNILIVNKPEGVLSQKAKPEDISMVEYIIDYMINKNDINEEQLKTFRPSICNRLDRNTSGLLIGGKTLIGLQKITEYIKNRDVDKYYLALVKGKVNKDALIDGYIVKDKVTNKVKVYKQNPSVENLGKNNEKPVYIKTKYMPIAFNSQYTLLKVELITGKTHQIRAHLASINHPIIGDYKYGDKNLNDKIKKTYKIKNQMLHAYELEFHNEDDDVLGLKGKTFKAMPPMVFNKILKDQFRDISLQ